MRAKYETFTVVILSFSLVQIEYLRSYVYIVKY